MRRQLRDLQPPAHVFRPVDQNGLDMTLLRDSIDSVGLLVPLTICKDVIVDGYRRWLTCKGLGWTEIDVHEVEGDDPDQLRIVTQTRHTEFTRNDKRAFIGRYVCENPDLPVGVIAHYFQWSTVEIEELVGVGYLIPEIQKAYRDGRIALADVFHLAKIRDQGQLQLWMDGTENLFDRAQALHREERSARRRSMVSRARGKGYTALVKERDNPSEAGLCLIKANAKTPLDGWKACMDWVLGNGM